MRNSEWGRRKYRAEGRGQKAEDRAQKSKFGEKDRKSNVLTLFILSLLKKAH
jgi:hypothetical protein